MSYTGAFDEPLYCGRTPYPGQEAVRRICEDLGNVLTRLVTAEVESLDSSVIKARPSSMNGCETRVQAPVQPLETTSREECAFCPSDDLVKSLDPSILLLLKRALGSKWASFKKIAPNIEDSLHTALLESIQEHGIRSTRSLALRTAALHPQQRNVIVVKKDGNPSDEFRDEIRSRIAFGWRKREIQAQFVDKLAKELYSWAWENPMLAREWGLELDNEHGLVVTCPRDLFGSS